MGSFKFLCCGFMHTIYSYYSLPLEFDFHTTDVNWGRAEDTGVHTELMCARSVMKPL